MRSKSAVAGAIPACVVLCVVSAPAPVAAQTLTTTLNPASLAAASGTFTVKTRLVNAPGNPLLFITGANLFLPGAGLSSSPNPFLHHAPVSLAAGADSGEFAAFTVTLADSPPAGGYRGTFSVLGGTMAGQLNEIGTAEFTLNEAPPDPGPAVPEGEGRWLFLAVLPALAWVRRRPRAPLKARGIPGAADLARVPAEGRR